MNQPTNPSPMIEAGRKAWQSFTEQDPIPDAVIQAIYEAMRPHDRLFRQLVEALEKIGSMTDIEADFDGFEARDIARSGLLAAQEAGVTP